MKAKFVSYLLPETATITKTSVRTSEGFQSLRVIALRTNFGNKDEAKAWAKAHGGSWHPVEKFWWVPGTVDNLKSLKDLSFFTGEFYAPSEKLQGFISDHFDDSPEEIQEGVIFDEISVFPEENTYMSGYTTLRGEELPQMQGWIQVGGGSVRVLLLEKKPADSPEWMQCSPRQYQRSDGNSVWAVPWEDPTDRWSMASWPDADVEVSKPPEPAKTKSKEILVVKALMKGEACVGARGYCQKGLSDYQWDRALSWCKSQSGRKWNDSAKAWDIPLSEELKEDIQRSLGIDYQGGHISFSDRLLQELGIKV